MYEKKNQNSLGLMLCVAMTESSASPLLGLPPLLSTVTQTSRAIFTVNGSLLASLVWWTD